jgi:D-alanyl-D-alanine carboxypeptidase
MGKFWPALFVAAGKTSKLHGLHVVLMPYFLHEMVRPAFYTVFCAGSGLNRPFGDRIVLDWSIKIRTADVSDLRALKSLCLDSAGEQDLHRRILDRCVLIAEDRNPESRGRTIASIGIDLDLKEIRGLSIAAGCEAADLGKRMVSEAEKLAVQFGILNLNISVPASFVGLLRSCRYQTEGPHNEVRQSGNGKNCLSMHRSFPRRQTRYSRLISKLLRDLDIPQDYGRIHRIFLQEEASRLDNIPADIYGREQRMLPPAAKAWHAMRELAARQDILLQAVSAYRSVAYQTDLIRRKLDKGLAMEKILNVSAAPGYSEHHSGRAIDITSPGTAVLEEAFEKSPAFEWLQAHAPAFGFQLSFPRGNRHGVAYEPWHWAWHAQDNRYS